MNKEVMYLCDRRQCDNCSSECKHTTNIEHAKNFINNNGVYEEQHKGFILRFSDKVSYKDRIRIMKLIEDGLLTIKEL